MKSMRYAIRVYQRSSSSGVLRCSPVTSSTIFKEQSPLRKEHLGSRAILKSEGGEKGCGNVFALHGKRLLVLLC